MKMRLVEMDKTVLKLVEKKMQKGHLMRLLSQLPSENKRQKKIEF